MRRLLAFAAAVFCLCIAVLGILMWSVFTPLQRWYVEPEIESELAALIPPVGLLGVRLIDPHVTLVLRDQNGAWRWFTLSAATVRDQLRSAYHVPVAAMIWRLLLLAAVQTVVLLAAHYATLRAAVRAARQQSGVPIQIPEGRT